jgi:hypothetical protein
VGEGDQICRHQAQLDCGLPFRRAMSALGQKRTSGPHIAMSAWHWSFKMTAGPPGFQQHGTAMSLEEAKAKIETQWACSLAAAGLRQG